MPPKRVIATFFALIALLHGYIGWRLVPALGQGGNGLIVLLALSTVLSPGGLLARAIRQPGLSDALSWLGLSLLGWFSSLLSLTVLRDLLLAGGRLFDAGAVAAAAPGSARAVLWLSAAASVLGFHLARRTPRVREVDIVLPQLPAALDGFSIVQLSDIHVGPTIKRRYLERIVARANRLAPDLIAITGDLVDGSVRRLAADTAPLARLAARHGVFVVTGNHEYYSGAREWIGEFRRLGLTVLENAHRVIDHAGSRLLLAGITDYSAGHFADGQPSDPQAALAGAPAVDGPKILLAHQPRSAFAAAEAGFDLQLSGHTHGGQFLPWNALVPLQQPFVAGLNRVGRLAVYTSRGTGYWGPPLRLGAPSEITRIRLRCPDPDRR